MRTTIAPPHRESTYRQVRRQRLRHLLQEHRNKFDLRQRDIEYLNQDIYATFTIEVIPDVDWDDSRMAATSGGSELALFVTYRGGNTAYGYWFVKSADGYEMFEFKAVGGVYSSPDSGFVITSDGDGITVTYDGETYTFGAADVTRVLGAAAQGGAA